MTPPAPRPAVATGRAPPAAGRGRGPAPGGARRARRRAPARAAATVKMDAALASTERVVPGSWPDTALCVHPEWLEKILRGVKTVELRGTVSKKEVGTRLGLICCGTSRVYGECTFVECRGPLTDDELLELQPRHRVRARDDGEPDTADALRARINYRDCYGWFVKDAVVYETPLAYEHPGGAQTWVNLTQAVPGHQNRDAPRGKRPRG
ncbi:ASCH domain containing protein [Aureococcus anophagefferens]|nr:ASCH domain containing protein [Aureococcus anophagefferens]